MTGSRQGMWAALLGVRAERKTAVLETVPTRKMTWISFDNCFKMIMTTEEKEPAKKGNRILSRSVVLWILSHL